MQKSLPLIIIFVLIAVSALHRGGISFQAHLLWMMTLLPLLVCGYFLRKKSQQQDRSPIPSMILGILMALLLAVIAGWVTSSMKDFGIISVTGVVGGIAMMLITMQLEITEDHVKKFFDALCVFGAGLGVFGLVVYATTPLDRVASTFMHLPYLVTSYPNAFALFLLILLPFVVMNLGALQQHKNLDREKITWLIIAGIIGTSLLLTFSRGALITAMIIIGALFMLKKIQRTRMIIVLSVTILVLTFGLQLLRPANLASNSFSEKITFRSDEKASSVSERMEFWKGALHIIIAHPWLGTGPDTFRYIFPANQHELLADADHPHNFILEQAVEFGVPSAILLLTLIGVAFYRLRHTFRHISHKGAHEDTYLALGLSLSAIILHNLVDYNLNFTSTAVLFWLILGIIINLTQHETHTPQTHLVPARAVKCISIILVVTLFAGGWYEIYERNLIVQARDFDTYKNYSQTEKIFRQTHPIFYEDAILLRANNAINMGNFALAKNILQDVIKRNIAYAEAYNMLSEISLKEKNVTSATKYNTLALQYDSQNNLRYHHETLAILAATSTTPDSTAFSETQLKFYTSLLKQYLSLLRQNAHETVRSDNPSYSIKIATLLQNMTKIPLHRLTFKKLKNDLFAAATLERKKFFDMFNIPLTPL